MLTDDCTANEAAPKTQTAERIKAREGKETKGRREGRKEGRTTHRSVLGEREAEFRVHGF